MEQEDSDPLQREEVQEYSGTIRSLRVLRPTEGSRLSLGVGYWQQPTSTLGLSIR